MDRFSELRALTAVIDAGGFAAAARAIGQSRSSVNRLVIALEERLGVQLLHRTTRSVSPTSSGRALYQRAGQILDDLEEMEKSVTAARRDPVGLLRMSVPFSFGELDFSALLAQFMGLYPAVEVDVSFENRFVDPVAEGFDLVIRVGQPDEMTTLVDHRVLLLDYVFCASPSYLAAQGRPNRLGDLADHATLYQRTSNAAPAFAAEGSAGPESVALAPVLTSNNLQTLLTGARAGLGVAVLPEYAVRRDLQESILTQILDDYVLPQRMLQVVYPPARHLSAKVRVFTDYVESWCGIGP